MLVSAALYAYMRHMSTETVTVKKMSSTIKFSQKAFKRGVDDVLTLAPLREAVREVVRSSASGAFKSSSKAVAPSDSNRGTYGRDPARKAG